MTAPEGGVPAPLREAPDAPAAPADSLVRDAELHALMRQARRTGDVPLRRLVIGYLALRRVTADVVAMVAAREGGAGVARTPLFLRARTLATAPPR